MVDVFFFSTLSTNLNLHLRNMGEMLIIRKAKCLIWPVAKREVFIFVQRHISFAVNVQGKHLYNVIFSLLPHHDSLKFTVLIEDSFFVCIK